MVKAVTERLDRDAWVRAALKAFEEGGPAAVAVVPLAERLGVTRGSFYWHFDGRDELLRAALELWEREHSDEVLAAAERIADPRERLTALGRAAASKPPSIFVRLLLAADDPLVAEVLARSTARRLELLERTYREADVSPARARRLALAAYAEYVGMAHLLHEDPALLASPRDREAFARELTARLDP